MKPIDKMANAVFHKQNQLPDSFLNWVNSKQWVLWRKELRKGSTDKYAKKPYSPFHCNVAAKTNDPSTWGTFKQAYENIDRFNMHGIGYVFSEKDNIVGIDLDHVINLETGKITDSAQEILSKFSNTFIEYSPSGDGFHIWVKGTWILKAHKILDEPKWLEIYDYKSPRYFTVTGNRFSKGIEIVESQEQINWIADTFFNKREVARSQDSLLYTGDCVCVDDSTHAVSRSVTVSNKQSRIIKDTPIKDVSIDDLSEEDKKTINRLTGRRRERFNQLFSGDYGNDHSSADWELLRLLAWCTGYNTEQIKRIFLASGLCQTEDRIDKWERLGRKTIDKIISNR